MKYYIQYKEEWTEIISLSDDQVPPDGFSLLIPLNPAVKCDLVEHREKSIRLIFDEKRIVYWDIVIPTDEPLSDNVIDIPVANIFLCDYGEDLSTPTNELQSEIKEIFNQSFQKEVLERLKKARENFDNSLAQIEDANENTCAIVED